MPHAASILRRLIVLTMAAMYPMLLGQDARAQTTRPIKIIVPSTPGGGADVVARMLAQQIGRSQGVSIFVENRPGGANTIGTEMAARAAPDGNTVLITTPEFVINSHLRKLNYDPLTSFEPICYLARSPQVVLVNAASPYHSLADFLSAARAKPGELTLGSTSVASSPHIAFEALRRAADVNIVYVPFQGATPAVTALLGNQVSSALVSYPNAVAQLNAGKLRALAVTSRTRMDQMRDVPTLAEAGFKGIEADLWFGSAVPAHTPKEAVTRLADWFSAALQVPDIKSKLSSQGLFAVATCGADFARFTQDQYDQYGKEIRDAGIKEE